MACVSRPRLFHASYPKSGHLQCGAPISALANSGHWPCYSITSSAAFKRPSRTPARVLFRSSRRSDRQHSCACFWSVGPFSLFVRFARGGYRTDKDLPSNFTNHSRQLILGGFIHPRVDTLTLFLQLHDVLTRLFLFQMHNPFPSSCCAISDERRTRQGQRWTN